MPPEGSPPSLILFSLSFLSLVPYLNPFTNFFLLLLTITSHLISCTIIHDPQDEHVGATRFLQEFHKPVHFLQGGKQVLHQTCKRLLPLSPFFDSASTFGNAHKQSILCRCVNFCLERQLECWVVHLGKAYVHKSELRYCLWLGFVRRPPPFFHLNLSPSLPLSISLSIIIPPPPTHTHTHTVC